MEKTKVWKEYKHKKSKKIIQEGTKYDMRKIT